MLQVDKAEETLRALHFAEDPLGRVRAPVARHPHVEDGRLGLNAPHQAGGAKKGRKVKTLRIRRYISIRRVDMVRHTELYTAVHVSSTWTR